MKRIEICGGIASGKTTLTKLLELNGYNAIYECFDDNPFLKQFYQQEGRDISFETEMVFILLHYSQIRQRENRDFVVSDYSMLQDYCYALQNLNGDQMKLFKSIYDYLLEQLYTDNLFIYLKCGTACLKDRIRMRNRDIESSISELYLNHHIEILERQLSGANKVLVIDSEKYDFTGPDNKKVLDMIKEYEVGNRLIQ